MTKQYWLVKQEPETYAWATFVADGQTVWDGVRNFQARNNLKAMKAGDAVLFYASMDPRQVMGVAEVAEAAFPDPTVPAEEGWVSVRLRAVRALRQPVTLAMIKADPTLADIALIRQSRLSVMPLRRAEFDRIVRLGSP
ncbi:MAG: EVE domain-containing protein [Verrucomicrobia bacterium]|nr:EVE domain-containing protein [Verrucomicrobiota bacterium]